MWRVLSLLLLTAWSREACASKPSRAWSVDAFTSLVTFGDSYTDEQRLNWFVQHNGSAPPTGTLLGESSVTASGGKTWPRFVIQYTGQEINDTWSPQMTLYDYAVSGAVCSNAITPRTDSGIHANFPAVLEYEVPAFLADKQSLRNGTDETYFTPPLTASNAVYSVWIGTNDIGVYAFLTDSQVPGNVLTDYIDCVYVVLDQLYRSGARNFVLMNLAPLELTPLYANESAGGVGVDHYWPEKPSNKTLISETMKEYTTTINTVYKYRTPFDVLVANRYPGANFAMYDVHSLLVDIYHDPTAYLNGTLPANVTGFDSHCDLNVTNCTRTTSPDSFLWYDELHPSEQTDRIIAREFVEVLSGNSSYASYYAGPTYV